MTLFLRIIFAIYLAGLQGVKEPWALEILDHQVAFGLIYNHASSIKFGPL